MPLITLEQQKIMAKLYEDTFIKFMQEHATLVELVSQISINRYTQEEYRQIVQSICTNLAEKEATDIVHGNMECDINTT